MAGTGRRWTPDRMRKRSCSEKTEEESLQQKAQHLLDKIHRAEDLQTSELLDELRKCKVIEQLSGTGNNQSLFLPETLKEGQNGRPPAIDILLRDNDEEHEDGWENEEKKWRFKGARKMKMSRRSREDKKEVKDMVMDTPLSIVEEALAEYEALERSIFLDPDLLKRALSREREFLKKWPELYDPELDFGSDIECLTCNADTPLSRE